MENPEPVLAMESAAETPRLLGMPEGQQRQVLAELLRAGKSDGDIGALFRLSQWQVRNLRYRLGIKKDRGGNVHVLPSAAGAAGSRVAVRIEGWFEGSELARRLMALGQMVEASPGRYRIEMGMEQGGTD